MTDFFSPGDPPQLLLKVDSRHYLWGLIFVLILIPFFIVLYFGWKLFKRTKIWKPKDMDFVTGIPSLEETEIPEVPPKNIGEKIARILF